MRRSILLLTLAVSVTAPAAAAKVMFTTLESGYGNLSAWDANPGALTGVAAGNAICQNLAQAAELANFSAYRAWLSDSTTDAYCNVAGFSGKKVDKCGESDLPGGGPWVRTDGKPFAASLGELTTSHAVLYVPQVDQHGDLILAGSMQTMTGTTAAGAATGIDCSGWTSDYGFASARGGRLESGATTWTEVANFSCDQTMHLYCFEAGSGTDLAKFDAPGAYAFVTSASGNGDLGSWADAGEEIGLAAGDAVCRTAAENGRLPSPDSYVAWLSDSSTHALSRLTIDGPWRRPDGVRIASSKSTLQLMFHESSIEIDELGAHVDSFVFTGSWDNGLASGDDCGDWQGGTGSATSGQASSAGSSWGSGFSPEDCSLADQHLYCFSNVVVVLADGFESGGTNAWSTTVP